MDWPGAGAGFTAHDHPIDRGEIDFTEGFEQRLNGDETDAGKKVEQTMGVHFFLWKTGNRPRFYSTQRVRENWIFQA
jgi:hypothetical protein